MLMSEAQRKRLFKIRAAMDGGVTLAAEKGAAAVNTMTEMIRPWIPGTYVVGDVRLYNDIPYKCVQGHDSSANPDWVPSTYPALWMQYHGTSKDTARAWVAPTGAQDMYLVGEWMIYTDGKLYECLTNTAYSPTDLPSAWKADGTEPTEPTTPAEGTEEWPEFVQPTGAQDAYKTDDKITFNGQHYVCIMDNCVYSPADYAQAWRLDDGNS